MSFNQAQKKAIAHVNGPCLVLAGPGSGKTLTIVNRIKNLIEKQKVRPEEILVITFTKYAAAEMKARVSSMMKGKNLPITMGTFHGIYYGILKWAYKLGPQNILSEEEKYQIVRQIISHKEIEIFDEEDFLQEIVTDIGIVKNNRINIEEYHSRRCSTAIFQEIYQEYESFRKQIRKLDFDDMLVQCYQLFVQRPDILRMWQGKFKYILVDEFQDINQVQYDVIKMLAEPEKNLFVVGDDDQSIYGFRGADAKIMFAFKDDYPDSEQILLDVNYRSTANIVQNARKVIEHNQIRFEKNISAKKKSGISLHVQETTDSNEESEYVAGKIAERVQNGVPLEEIAVLYRTHTDARALVEKLAESRIPFQMKEIMPNLYQHFIAKDIMAYFRLATGNGSRSDFIQIMNRPKRYLARECVSSSGIWKIQSEGELAGVGQKQQFEEIRKFYMDKDWMQDRVDQMEFDLKILGRITPYGALNYLRKKVGYDDFLREYAQVRKMDIQDFKEILAEIEEAMRLYETFDEWFKHVDEYTKMLKTNEQKKEIEQTGVRLMTIHASKGLEFDTVFIIQTNEGRIPYQKSLREENEEEERRLFYVGMTRAKEMLQITYVKQKNGKEKSPSRFIDELLEGI
ncbi:MAG: ATP-dependent helicase [Schaedlerella sp.]|nr:ATP-dependent helicase [Schaedlerella sp.]